MKRIVFLLSILLPMTAMAQVPSSYQGAMIYAGGSWAPWTAGSGGQSINPDSYIGLLCQSTANGPWTGCNTAAAAITSGTISGLTSLTVPQANCLSEPAGTSANGFVPCEAYNGTFTGLTATGGTATTGTITIYTNNAPAGAVLQVCPNIVVGTAGSAGGIAFQPTWTTPGSVTLSAPGVIIISSTTPTASNTTQPTGACATFSLKANTSFSFNVNATVLGSAGSLAWETEPVVTRLQ